MRVGVANAWYVYKIGGNYLNMLRQAVKNLKDWTSIYIYIIRDSWQITDHWGLSLNTVIV